MTTPDADRVFKPALPLPPDYDEAELEAKTLASQLNLPEDHSIYPCISRFYSWADKDAKNWFQLRFPSGGETTLSREELLAQYPLTPL